jgi:hypothetical protein
MLPYYAADTVIRFYMPPDTTIFVNVEMLYRLLLCGICRLWTMFAVGLNVIQILSTVSGLLYLSIMQSFCEI